MLNCTSQRLKSTRCDEFNVREQSNISYLMFKTGKGQHQEVQRKQDLDDTQCMIILTITE